MELSVTVTLAKVTVSVCWELPLVSRGGTLLHATHRVGEGGYTILTGT